MPTGYLALVLHAHLPFLRHPEDATVMEERWLYEAVADTYLPLLRVFEGLAADRVPFRCTLSLSAPLLCMLRDDLLKQRIAHHLDDLIALGEREIERTKKEPWYGKLALMYRDRFVALRGTWRAHDGDLVRAFRRLQDGGTGLEVITSNATHAFLPLMDRNWPAMRAQVELAADLYERCFGRRTPGMWLGECGYVPGVEELLRAAAVRYFFVDSHALTNAQHPPVFGIHAPLYCHDGVAAIARDDEASRQVWSAKEGYPGDSQYRDFYRDIGFDLPLDVIGPWIHPEGHRLYTGFKYHAITHSQLHDKWVYDPEVARGKAGLHATHFRESRRRQSESLRGTMDRPPLIVAPFDAELFGHWWFEGVQFLDDLFRQMHFDQSRDDPAVEPITISGYLDRHPKNQVATPSASSWGAKGFNEYWLNESNAWVYRHLHEAAERMVALARKFAAGGTPPGPLEERALKQCVRELLLAQSSDWAFIMKTGTTVSYATRRTNEAILRFMKLHDELVHGRIDEPYLKALEAKDNLFADADWRVYAG
ncbi:MAG TPA: 1,4-alpha-glucan branching protein domain-containing protein [Planctomycetota bacterium]|nr:1,4-alpha-glucan branching protein domain-containing protein [Planctomycetota bacterium]